MLDNEDSCRIMESVAKDTMNQKEKDEKMRQVINTR